MTQYVFPTLSETATVHRRDILKLDTGVALLNKGLVFSIRTCFPSVLEISANRLIPRRAHAFISMGKHQYGKNDSSRYRSNDGGPYMV